MKLPVKRLFCFAVLPALVSCVSGNAQSPRASGASAQTLSQNVSEKPFSARFNQLQLNMSSDEVLQLLGPADLRAAELKKSRPDDPTGVPLETWHYRADGGRVVHFENGKVTSFGPENQAQAPVLPPTNLGLGAECKSDSECSTHNCHFHRCSGKDNCSVPNGGMCATNADCCSHFCDFGTCRKK